MTLPLQRHDTEIRLPKRGRVPFNMKLSSMRMALYAMTIAVLLSACVYAQDPMIEADETGITFIVQDGQRIGYRIGDKNVTFADDMPTDWRQYTNTMFMSMFSAMQSTGPAATGGALGLPGMESMSFSDLELAAAGGTVNFWMWNGGARYNKWVDEWLAPRMRSKYQIDVTRAPDPSGAATAVARVAQEVLDGNTDAGSVDLIWINGNNFRNLKSAGNAYCGWAHKLPSGKNYNWFSPAIAFDFGVPTSGCEMPYNTAQIVFFYHQGSVGSPPRSIPALMNWIRANPGKFQYANPTGGDGFIGAAFIRQVFYYFAGAAQGGTWEEFLGSSTVNEELYLARAPLVFTQLKTITDRLALTSFPAQDTVVNELFANGTVTINLAYDPSHAGAGILAGTYPNDTMSYVMEDGTISNTNFVGIPNNAANKAAALVTANMVASLEGAFTRAQPEYIGSLPAYDATSATFQASGWDAAFDYIDAHASVPSQAELVGGRLSELSSDYKDRINSDWDYYVRQGACGPNPNANGVDLGIC